MNGVMYVPTATGGHARYASELLGALHEVADRHDFALVTSRNLAAEFRSGTYRVHDVLPPLKTTGFASAAAWACDRATHYYRREKSFLDWVLERRDVNWCTSRNTARCLPRATSRGCHAPGAGCSSPCTTSGITAGTVSSSTARSSSCGGGPGIAVTDCSCTAKA